VAIATSHTKEWLDLRASEVVRGVSNAHPIFVERALGAKLWDIDGKEYFDFIGGIGVLNVGHAHPKVVKAVAGSSRDSRIPVSKPLCTKAT